MSKPINLVFFTEAIQIINRLTRIMSMNRGHALLIGMGGSGRTILTRMAAFIKETQIVTI